MNQLWVYVCSQSHPSGSSQCSGPEHPVSCIKPELAICFIYDNIHVSMCHSCSSKEQASFNFMAAVTICSDFGVPQNEICHYFHCFPSICHEMMGLDVMILVFSMLIFKPAFHSPLSLSSRDSLIPLHFQPFGWYHLHI